MNEPFKQWQSLSKLRKAFIVAGGVLAAFLYATHLGTSYMADETADILRQLNLKQHTLGEITASRLHIAYPESRATRLFAYSTLDAEFIRETSEAGQANGPALYPLSFQSRRAVLPFAACTVIVPSDKLSRETVFDHFTDLKPYWLKNRPGTADDYRRIILFHEAAHCDHSGSAPQEEDETAADIAALDLYLKQGGDSEVVRSFIYFRAMAGLRQIVNFDTVRDPDAYAAPGRRYDAAAYPYVMAPVLSHRYLDGPAMSLADSRRAHLAALEALKDYAAGHQLPMDRFLTGIGLQKGVEGLLAEHGDKIDPQARKILELYRESCRFFTQTPAIRPAPAGRSPH